MRNKSPLRYPGGKSRAINHIVPRFPITREIISPFLGGGSIELHCAKNGIYVRASDSFEPLVNFWLTVKNSPFELTNLVMDIKNNITKEFFYDMRRIYDDETDNVKKAAYFFALNRSSFSGGTFSSGWSAESAEKRFSHNSIKLLKSVDLANIEFACKDFNDVLHPDDDTFVYLDPPYAIDSCLYGVAGNKHKNFDHNHLSSILHKRKNWILSYNDSKFIRDLYKDYPMETPKWSYGMSDDKKSKEILILNTKPLSLWSRFPTESPPSRIPS